jgi:PAS domain S-box-containing protein
MVDSMILALDGTVIAASLISTIGVLGVGLMGYLGIRTKITESNELNTSQHGDVASVVRSMESLLRDVDATIGLLVSTQGFPLFKNTAEGALIWVNAAALELLGMTFEELADPHGWQAAIYPEDRDRVNQNWVDQMSVEHPLAAITFRYQHPLSGKITKVRAMSRPVRNRDGDIREWVSMVVPLYDHVEEKHTIEETHVVEETHVTTSKG